jgi:hypothetical protein
MGCWQGASSCVFHQQRFARVLFACALVLSGQDAFPLARFWKISRLADCELLP